jgi:type IV pilus assembly protein PilW
LKLPYRQSTLQRQQGISLVEIMIAMLLGLILTGGILQMLSSSRQSNRVHEATARMQENGRMGLEVISRDVRMADFWGCASDIANIVSNLDSAGIEFIDFDEGSLNGTEGALGAPDTIVLRGGFGSSLGLAPPYGPGASTDIQVAADNGLGQGDIVLVSDCSDGDVFQISNADPGDNGTIAHDTSNATEPGNVNASNPGCPGSNTHCLSKVYGPDASVFRAQEISYSISIGESGGPALFRNGSEFLNGIEDFQVLYGEDTDATNVANYFVPATQIADMNKVVSIRFALVARSQDDNLTGGAIQNYNVLGLTLTAPDLRLRQVYMSTVNIRNRL